MRLYFAERLLEDKVPAQCKFHNLGCQVELKGHLLMQHENGRCPYEPVNCDFDHRGCVEKISRSKKSEHLRICEFRMVDCPIIDCKAQVVQQKMLAHLQERHYGMRNDLWLRLFVISVIVNFLLIIIFIMFFM